MRAAHNIAARQVAMEGPLGSVSDAVAIHPVRMAAFPALCGQKIDNKRRYWSRNRDDRRLRRSETGTSETRVTFGRHASAPFPFVSSVSLLPAIVSLLCGSCP